MDKISHVKTNIRIRAWSDMVREQNESGLSVSEWCINNGINLKTYYYRQRKVREYICEHDINSDNDTDSLNAKRLPQHDIVPISIGDIPNNDTQQIKIITANISVELPPSVQPQLLKAAIEGLKC